MTIQSYLVYPNPGQEDQSRTALSGIPGCELLAAKNRPVLVLVTETPDRPAQRELERRLESLSDLAHFALVSGWTEEIP